MGESGIILLIFVMFGVVLIVQYIQWRKGKARTQALKQVAQNRLFTFIEKEDNTSQYQRFYLTSRGYRHKIYNQMQGTFDGVDVRFFDYYFVTGSGKHKKRHNQTVIEFESPHLDLVGFTIRSNQFLDSLREQFGNRSVDMHDETFNSRFNVYSHHNGTGDDDAIRTLLNSEVRRSLLRESARLVVEGDGNRVLIWRQNQRVKEDQIERALTEARAIFELLANPLDGSRYDGEGEKLTFGDDGWRSQEKQPDDPFSNESDWGGWQKS